MNPYRFYIEALRTLRLRGQDPELVAIEEELRSTASYAIDPSFKERLRRELMEMMR